MKKTNAMISGIFPTPVYITQLNRKFIDKENKFINQVYKKDNYKNEGNLTSNDTYILNSRPFNTLKKELNKIIKDYCNKVLSTSNNIEPYITQSWLNYTKEGQYHHKHAHPNSIISGVLYINADKVNDKIFFFKEKYELFRPEIKEYNIWNSESWFFSIKTGDVVLFPSSLTHMVKTKEGTNTRISLSFNVFFKGTIGSYHDLTELII